MRFSNTIAVAAASSIAVNAFSTESFGDTLIKARDYIPGLARRSGGGGSSGGSGSGSGGGGGGGDDNEGGGGGGSCPAVWTTLAGVLQAKYLTSGQCNDFARAAIREAFHDCGAWELSLGNTGGCDGSLILAGETTRPENNGLQEISAYLGPLATQFNVGVADLIQFSAAVAVVTCPEGPTVQTFVGRNDSSTPAPPNLLPSVFASGESLYELFLAKGISAEELAALVGAHTCSKEFFVTANSPGIPQDTTPGIWDVDFYGQTVQSTPPAGVFVFPSDSNLAAHPVVGPQFHGFVNNQGKWTGKFAKAMTHLSTLGVSGGTSQLIDCTSALPKGTNNKRDMRAAPINARIR